MSNRGRLRLVKEIKTESSFEFPMRLVKYVSQAGVASRRKSAELIKLGNFAVNDSVVLEPGFKVDKDSVIRYNSKIISLNERTYIMLNKPIGYLCSAFDPHADKIVFDLIKLPGKRLFTVGRLDLNSEGLLLLTDDGGFAEKVTHPKYGVLKTYSVKTAARLSKKSRESIVEGFLDAGEFLQAKKVQEKPQNEYIFTMSEGKKREVRRLVKAVKGSVLSLRRTSIAKLKLGNLPQGKWRYLTTEEVLSFSQLKRK